MALFGNKYFFIVYFILAIQRSTGRLLRLLPLIVGLLVTLFTIFLIVQAFLPPVYQAVGLTLDLTLFSEDSTRYERSEIMLSLLQFFHDSGQMGWNRLGNMWSGATRMGMHYNLHNTYLAYMVIGGLPGLLLSRDLDIPPDCLPAPPASFTGGCPKGFCRGLNHELDNVFTTDASHAPALDRISPVRNDTGNRIRFGANQTRQQMFVNFNPSARGNSGIGALNRIWHV